MQGALITFYGINNIGKTTQSQLLVKRLQAEGIDAVYVKYPIYDTEPTGGFLNRVLRQSEAGVQRISEHELQMWFTLNRHQFEPTLKKWLEEGKIVIAEDYTGTGIGWGTTKGADQDWLEDLNRYLLKEDFAVLLEGVRTMKAKEEGHIHESDDALVERAREVFSRLGDECGWARVQMEPVKEASAEKIYKVVKNFLSAR
ncbi:MAG: hypothetical protein WC101_00570 [Candidatus Gracilibacteria bacterium]